MAPEAKKVPVRLGKNHDMVRGADGDFHGAKAVPHGEVRSRWYLSKVIGAWRRCDVCTPPDYDANFKARYPVLPAARRRRGRAGLALPWPGGLHPGQFDRGTQGRHQSRLPRITWPAHEWLTWRCAPHRFAPLPLSPRTRTAHAASACLVQAGFDVLNRAVRIDGHAGVTFVPRAQLGNRFVPAPCE